MPEIPQPVLDEIKHRVDMAALVSEHLSLKRSGRGFVGLCPFHEEKTPSFYVNPERGTFHCFGCDVGGNAFTFVMRVTGQTFPEVVRELADKVGVAIPESKAAAGQERLVEANRLAAELFQVVLHESQRGQVARKYLEDRGISEETTRRFGLGFAPGDKWVEKLRAREVTMADLKRVGLVTEGRSGPYPLFRDRLIFPIQDLSGRVIAFGGRAIGEASGPKYLNSPESPLYRKGFHLYGMDLARDEARSRGQVVLVEGYMDAIALAQAGMTNAVAVLGTALTADQLRLARRFASDIVVCFDGDEAGRRAALRAFPICVDEVDLWPKAVFLPSGEDPDSLVRGGGTRAMEDLIGNGQSLVDFFLDDLVGPDGGLGETARAANTMAGVLAKVKDPIVRDKLVRGAAGRLGVRDDALLAAARKAHLEQRRTGRRVDGGATQATRPGGSTRPGRVRFSSDAEMVELIVCDQGVAERARSEGALALIEDGVLRAIAENVLERRRSAEYFEPLELLPDLPSAMAERVRLRIEEGAVGEVAARAADEWFAAHAARAHRGDRKALIAQLRAAEHRGDRDGVRAALEAIKNGASVADLPSGNTVDAVAEEEHDYPPGLVELGAEGELEGEAEGELEEDLDYDDYDPDWVPDGS